MDILLSPETRRLIEQRVRRGDYPTPDEVVRAGLESLAQQESAGDFAPGELDRLLAAGEASGPPLDGEQVLAELAALRKGAHGRT